MGMTKKALERLRRRRRYLHLRLRLSRRQFLSVRSYRRLFRNRRPRDKDCTTRKKDNRNISFFDLGSGTGKLAVQAYLELLREESTPTQQQHLSVVGIELFPSRHQIAVESLEKLVRSKRIAIGDDDELMFDTQPTSNITLFQKVPTVLSSPSASSSPITKFIRNNNNDKRLKSSPPSKRKRTARTIRKTKILKLLQGDLFEIDISEATHIYIASLCFSESMMKQLEQKIVNESTSKLKCVATLQPFPHGLLLQQPQQQQNDDYHDYNPNQIDSKNKKKPRLGYVQMSWTAPSGAEVYFYDCNNDDDYNTSRKRKAK